MNKVINNIVDEYYEHFTDDGWEISYTHILSQILTKVLGDDWETDMFSQFKKKYGVVFLSDYISGVETVRRKRKLIMDSTIGFKHGLVYYNFKTDKLKVYKESQHDRKNVTLIGGL